MKNKKLLYIVLAVIAVLAILYITNILPPVPKEETSGTIGKAEKYRKAQMTEKDIILRSEFVQDTSALADAVGGLMVFNAFAKEYAGQLKTWTEILSNEGASLKSLQPLHDYYSYINNNIPVIENTISLLSDFYAGDTSDMSIDVEKKLDDFHTFVYTMFAKDSAVHEMIPQLEEKISGDITLKAKKDEEIKSLKKIHDEMIVKQVQLGLFAGQPLQDFMNRKTYDATGALGVWRFSNKSLEIFYNKALGPFYFCNKALGMANSGTQVMSAVKDLGQRFQSNNGLKIIAISHPLPGSNALENYMRNAMPNTLQQRLQNQGLAGFK